MKKSEKLYVCENPFLAELLADEGQETEIRFQESGKWMGIEEARTMLESGRAIQKRAARLIQWWTTEARYRPGGNGYINSLESFEKRIKTGFKQ